MAEVELAFDKAPARPGRQSTLNVKIECSPSRDYGMIR
jgi:hypothetical protein